MRNEYLEIVLRICIIIIFVCKSDEEEDTNVRM